MLENIIVGLLFSVLFGFLPSFFIFFKVDNIIIKTISIIILSLAIGYGSLYAMIGNNKAEIKKYNNGICRECNEQLELVSVYRAKGMSTEHYVFKCKNNHSIKLTLNPNNLKSKDE